VKHIGLVRVQTEVFLIPFSGIKDKKVTRGRLYKFTLLNSPKINTLWENCHHFLLAYQNPIKPIDLERGNPRIPWILFLDLEGPKYET
jgi:hypothetical protein